MDILGRSSPLRCGERFGLSERFNNEFCDSVLTCVSESSNFCVSLFKEYGMAIFWHLSAIRNLLTLLRTFTETISETSLSASCGMSSWLTSNVPSCIDCSMSSLMVSSSWESEPAYGVGFAEDGVLNCLLAMPFGLFNIVFYTLLILLPFVSRLTFPLVIGVVFLKFRTSTCRFREPLLC